MSNVEFAKGLIVKVHEYLDWLNKHDLSNDFTSCVFNNGQRKAIEEILKIIEKEIE